MYCIDTSILIEILRGNDEIKDKIKDFLNSETVFITSITLCELYKGADLYHKPEKIIEQIENLVYFYNLVNFDVNSCKEFGKLYKKLKEKGKMINEIDVLIASLVKSNNLILITRDNHFENLDIDVKIW